MLVESANAYDDNNWHSVIFSREHEMVKLVIDEEILGEKIAQVQKIDINMPFFIGGLKPADYNRVLSNLVSERCFVVLLYNKTPFQNTTQPFKGCIRNFLMNDKPMEKPIPYDIMPCSDNVEEGVFFSRGGGYIRLRERFKVGTELDLKLEIKPRNVSGILVGVHGRKDWLVLEMIDGRITLNVNNGKGPIETSFTPAKKHYFCDGNWHHIQGSIFGSNYCLPSLSTYIIR